MYPLLAKAFRMLLALAVLLAVSHVHAAPGGGAVAAGVAGAESVLHGDGHPAENCQHAEADRDCCGSLCGALVGSGRLLRPPAMRTAPAVQSAAVIAPTLAGLFKPPR